MFVIVGATLGCDSTPPPVRQVSLVDEVHISDVLANPQKFHGVRIRMKGACRIEFEGTALYRNPDAYRHRRGADGVWLSIGWPVGPRIQAIDGQEVLVEGTFDSTRKGHEASYVASLTDITKIADIEMPVSR
jgi:hypothetical protein